MTRLPKFYAPNTSSEAQQKQTDTIPKQQDLPPADSKTQTQVPKMTTDQSNKPSCYKWSSGFGSTLLDAFVRLTVGSQYSQRIERALHGSHKNIQAPVSPKSTNVSAFSSNVKLEEIKEHMHNQSDINKHSVENNTRSQIEKNEVITNLDLPQGFPAVNQNNGVHSRSPGQSSQGAVQQEEAKT